MSIPFLSARDDSLLPQEPLAPDVRFALGSATADNAVSCSNLKTEHRDSDSLQLIVLRHFSELEPWHDQCDVLADGIPFRRWQWLESWWHNYGTCDAQLCLVAIFNANAQLVALAPWYLDRTTVGLQRLRWLGSGEVCADHQSVLCRAEYREQVAQVLADWLTRTPSTGDSPLWDSLEISGTTADDPLMTCLVTELKQAGCRFLSRRAVHGWRIELPGTWPEYVAGLSKSHRKQVRRLERQVDGSSNFAFRVVQHPREVHQAMDILVELHQRRWHTQGESGCFASRHFEQFHREAVARLMDQGNVRLMWLEADGQPVAAEYQLLGNDGVYAYQSGIDPEYLALEPGRMMMTLAVRHAILRGDRFYDMLRGDEPYKAHWRAKPYALLEGEIIAPRRAAYWKYYLWRSARRASRWWQAILAKLVGHGSRRPNSFNVKDRTLPAGSALAGESIYHIPGVL